MPSSEIHAQHTDKELGEKAEDLHRWMDYPSEWAEYLHRFYRHNPNEPPEWAIKKPCCLSQKSYSNCFFLSTS